MPTRAHRGFARHSTLLVIAAAFAAGLGLYAAQRWVVEPSRRRLALTFASMLLCDMASYDWFFFVPVLVLARGTLAERT